MQQKLWTWPNQQKSIRKENESTDQLSNTKIPESPQNAINDRIIDIIKKNKLTKSNEVKSFLTRCKPLRKVQCRYHRYHKHYIWRCPWAVNFRQTWAAKFSFPSKYSKSLNLNSFCLINFEPLKMGDCVKNVCNSLTVYAKLFVKSLNLKVVAVQLCLRQ